MAVKWIWRSIGIVGFAMALSACHQNDTVFAVDTTDDTVDVTPGDGLCADANGDCSLRAAVIEANALPGVEEIRLVDGATYELTIPGGLEDEAFTGDIDIRSAVVITGDGTILGDGSASLSVDAPSGLTEIDGPNFTGGFRGLEVLNGSTVWVRHADFSAAPLFLEDGSLTVWASSFAVPTSPGVWAEDGSLRIENSSFLGSWPLVHLIRSDHAIVTIVSSTLSDGQVFVVGGGSGSVVAQSSILDVTCGSGMTSLGHNMVSGPGCDFGGPGDVDGGDYPVAGVLADNGGDVLTMIPDRYGPAVDAGKVAECTLTGTDARGIARPVGPACDIGAVEIEFGADCAVLAPGADLRYCDLRGADLSGIDLSGADAMGAVLAGADLSDATLVGATFALADLTNAHFDDADLTDADLSASLGAFYADGADFTRANLRDAAVHSADGANFTDADARGFGTWAHTGSMIGAHIEGADFTEGSFWGVTSGGVTGAATFSPGVGVVNGYIISRFVDLSGLDFSGTDFSAISLWNANATGADFSGATLTYSVSESHFIDATLDDVDLHGTYGWFVRFDDSLVVNADVSAGNMYASSWRNTMIVGADFTDTNLWNADFTDAALLWNTWDNTTCPSGVNSDDNGGNCDGQFTHGAPSVGGGAAVPAEFEGMSVEDFLAGGVVDE